MQIDNKLLKEAIEVLEQVRAEKPIVNCITNRVTINDCANMLLAMGASPIMAEDVREMEEIVHISDALVLNMGIQMTEAVQGAMLTAAAAAHREGKPVIFDPVGVGASKLRNDMAAWLLKEVKPDVIRGNLSEIKCLAGTAVQSRGVDSAEGDTVTDGNAQEVGEIIRSLAKAHRCVVCATGKIDVVTDGDQLCYIKNGHGMLCDVTGTGCMCSAMTGAACAAGGSFAGAVAAVVLLGLAGEIAQELSAGGIGTFRIKLLDVIYQMTPQRLLEGGRVYVE